MLKDKKYIKPKFIVGTSGWNFTDWKGVFYPEKLRKKDWLEFYETKFPVVEINATFYRYFSAKIFKNWRDKAKKHFRYVIKVNRYITHIKYLKRSTRPIKKFDKLVNLLGNKLALVLLQLPPNMPYDLERLENAILTFKHPKKVVVEFRNKKWLTPETKKLLKKLGCIFCATDSPNIKLIDWITSKTAYIRLHGRNAWYNYNYSKKELKEIAKFAKNLTNNGVIKVYILFNNDYYAYAIKNAMYLKKLLNEDE